MNFNRFAIALLAPVVLASVLLAGCHRAAPEQTSEQKASTGPAATAGIVLDGARLVLPAVKGNPGVVYVTIRNQTKLPTTIVSVTVAGAQNTEMHETQGQAMNSLPTVTLPAGATVTFAPGGKHIMAFKLSPSLAAGGRTDLTLTFSDGGKASTRLKIEPAGGDMGGMAM